MAAEAGDGRNHPRQRWPQMRVVHLPDYTRLAEELPDTDIFVGYSLRPQQLEDARKLKWIHSTAAGVAQLMYPELRDSGIVVTNPSGIFSVPMAEHTMGLLLALARNFPDSVRHQDRAHWGQQEIWDQPQHLTELNGQVLLIVGFGSIGRELARRAKAFDMTRLGRNAFRAGQTRRYAERIVPVSELHEVLAARGLRGDRRAGNAGNAASDRGGGNRAHESVARG